MFIIWGKKRVSRKVGYVADYCESCREPRPFLLKRIGSAGHLYYISFSSGELVGFERLCQKCSGLFSADPADYVTTSRRPESLEALTALTYPKLGETVKARIYHEENVRRNIASFSTEERQAVILDAMMSFAGTVEPRLSAIHVDKEIGFAVIATILLMGFGPELLDRLVPGNDWQAAPYFGAVGLLIIIWQIVVSPRRFMNRKVLPHLARTLQPIHPTDAELRLAATELTKRGFMMGKKLNLNDLKTHLQNPAFLR